MTKEMRKAVCFHCGSENVTADATAEWDIVSQRWLINSVFDKGAYCEDCDGETRIQMVDLSAEQTAGQTP